MQTDPVKLLTQVRSKMHSSCFGIMGSRGHFASNLVLKLTVEIGYVISKFEVINERRCLVHCCQF
jgi:hypothetical protein